MKKPGTQWTELEREFVRANWGTLTRRMIAKKLKKALSSVNLAAAGIERPRDEQGQPEPIPNTADTGYFSAANGQGVTDAGLEPSRQ